MDQKASFYFLLAFSFWISGCGVPYLNRYGEKGLTKEEFADYVESVFNFQNQLTGRAMMMADLDADSEIQNQVAAAEQFMHEECIWLDQYVSMAMDGQKPGILLQRKVEKSASECERAALKLEAELAKMSIEFD